MAEELHINCHICQKEMPYVALSDDLYISAFAYTTNKGIKLRTYLCPDCMKKMAKYIEDEQQKIIKED